MKTDNQKAFKWIQSDDTGISSKVIWSVMMGLPESIDRKSTPYDPADFGRCYRLLELIPEWEDKLYLLKDVSKHWELFVDNYEELCNLYKEEEPSGTCPKLYKFMKMFR